MKQTYSKLLFRGVRHSLARFFSIMGIVALGVGFLSGLLATSPDMELTVDRYYDRYSMHDVNIKGTYGITQEDVKEISSLLEIDRAMPAYVTDVVMQSADGSYAARIYGMPLSTQSSGEMLNNFELLSGRMPQNKNECVMATPNRYAQSDRIGTKYQISPENKNYKDVKKNYHFDTMTVVGIVQSPQYMSLESESTSVGNGKINMIMYVPLESYSMDVFTDLFLTVKGAKEENTFSDTYTDKIKTVVQKIEDIGIDRSEIRYESVRGEAMEKLDDATREYDKAKSEADEKLADARKKLDDAKKDITKGEQTLADAKKKLTDGKKVLSGAESTYQEQIAAASDKLTQKKKELEKAEATLNEQKKKLDSVKDQVEQAKKILETTGTLPEELRVLIKQYDEGMAAYEAGVVQLQDGKKQLAAGEKEWQQSVISGKEKLEAEKSKLAAAEKSIADNEEKLAKAKKELADGEAEYQSSKKKADKELKKGQKEIDDARETIEGFSKPKWYVSDRDDIASYSSYQGNVEKVEAIARVFPAFFFLVAALVALTTMTRMVEEERRQIGTLKALGYSNGTIALYYIGYSTLASLAGSVIGVLVGFQVLPLVISNAYQIMYNVPKTITVFWWGTAVAVSLVAIACTTVATIWACIHSLKEKPSMLMLPRAPKAGKRIILERIGFVWKRLKFTHKVTARNILRYKKRFFMTVIGIAGCCGLLVAGFGIRDSIRDIVRKQFGEIEQYNLTVVFKSGEKWRDDAAITDFLNNSDYVSNYSVMYTETGKIKKGDLKDEINIYVPNDTAKLKQHIQLRERVSGKDIAFNEDSVVLTEKICEEQGIKIGDTFTLVDKNGKSAELKVSGITESYLSANAYISAATYEKHFGVKPDYSMLWVKLHDDSAEKQNVVSNMILESDEVVFTQFSANIKETFSKTIKSIDYIVMVLIISAGALAIIVLYNLTNINICERKKELATIKVLGFYEKEVAFYIYRETTILSIIGTLLGFGFGVLLHLFVIKTIEVNTFMFGREIYGMSYLLAALVTMVFTVLVDFMMLPRLNHIDMVESMKAND